MNIFIASSAAFVFFFGLGMHVFSVSPRGKEHFHTTTVFAWLLMALFPVLIIFPIFPNTTIKGTLLGVTAGGAVALFLIIWIYGIRWSWKGHSLDVLQLQVNQLKTENEKLTDQLENSLQKNSKTPLPHSVKSYTVKGVSENKGASEKFLEVITGDITEVRNFDCWVNSENTYMEMARFFEKSISAVIRYHGASRDIAGNVDIDIIADELRKVLKGAKIVQPASVYLTSAGSLKETHNVQIIAHVASVTGQVGVGWKPIDNIQRCVGAVLREIESKKTFANVKTILFPLFGTGQATGSDTHFNAVLAIMAEAVDYMRKPECKIERVGFVAWTDANLKMCNNAINELVSGKKLKL
jgi:O-acetyl-ADP-ribose deacetylase (regulator of RNase III)